MRELDSRNPVSLKCKSMLKHIVVKLIKTIGKEKTLKAGGKDGFQKNKDKAHSRVFI